MQNSQLEPVVAALPSEPIAALSRRWWQQSAWWPAIVLLLVLGIANAPTAWVLASKIDGIWRSLAWCGVGSMMAQLMLIALLVASTTESWDRRLTRAYPLAVFLFALTAGGWYFESVYGELPLWPRAPTFDIDVRRHIGGVVVVAVEALVIGLFVAVLMCNHYQARFVHRLGNPPAIEELKWTLRDMLVWMTFLATTFAFTRFIPWVRTLTPAEEFVGGILCTGVVSLLFCFLSLTTLMELCVHSPRSEAVWNHKYTWYFFALLAALVALDGSGLLSEFESTACRLACILVAFGATTAIAIAALEGFGWRLMVSPKPRTHATRTGAQRSATSA